MNRIVTFAVSALAFFLLACGQTGQAHSPRTHAQAQVTHAVPVRLEIPKLGVDTRIEQVATDNGGQMGVPADYHDAAWYAPGVIPGDSGDAVISGHLDWVVSGKLMPAVFANLGTLAFGDELTIVGQDGRALRFSVTDTRAIAYNADAGQAGLFATGGPARVTLITCAGTFDQRLHQYTQRRIVTAQLQDN